MLQQMARDWIALSAYDPASPEYLAALKTLLAPVIAHNARPDSKPNGSALDQIRANENLANDPQPEMREFRLTANAPSGNNLAQDNC